MSALPPRDSAQKWLQLLDSWGKTVEILHNEQFATVASLETFYQQMSPVITGLEGSLLSDPDSVGLIVYKTQIEDWISKMFEMILALRQTRKRAIEATIIPQANASDPAVPSAVSDEYLGSGITKLQLIPEDPRVTTNDPAPPTTEINNTTTPPVFTAALHHQVQAQAQLNFNNTTPTPPNIIASGGPEPQRTAVTLRKPKGLPSSRGGQQPQQSSIVNQSGQSISKKSIVNNDDQPYQSPRPFSSDSSNSCTSTSSSADVGNRNLQEVAATASVGRGRGRGTGKQLVLPAPGALPTPALEIARTKMEHGTPYDAKLCYFESPSEFYIHFATEIANTDIAEKLAEAELHRKPPMSVSLIRKGEYCCSPDPVDIVAVDSQDDAATSAPPLRYYRGQILETDINRKNGELWAKVLFIDFGNAAWLPAVQLREFYVDSDGTLAHWTWQSFRCVLDGVIPAPGDSWSTEAYNLMTSCLCADDQDEQLVESKKIDVRMEGSLDEFTYLVSVRFAVMKEDGPAKKDLARTLVESGVARAGDVTRIYPSETQNENERPPPFL